MGVSYISIMIVVLVIIVIGLIIYNLSIHKKIKTFNNINERINNLNVLQEFLDTIGKDSSVDDKLQIINNILIDKFEIKYSTIVVFDGAEYVIKATNVDERHWDTMKNLHTDEMFRDSVETATPKYVTINKPEERLSYQKVEMGRAKSSMFFPLYIDNIYIGYWIIESGEAHAFDGMDTNILGIVKENIVAILKTVSYQNTIENIYRIDKFTGLNSAEYLYGKGKRVIDKYPQSTICMFRIMNIEKINEKLGRDAGTKLLINMTNIIKRSISSEYIFVRYMGPKFAIAFSGQDFELVAKFVKSVKEEIEHIKLTNNEEKNANKDKKRKEIISPRTNFVLATYYKGTGLEEVTKKLEEYLDDCDKNESNINCI
ncbi:MAG: diguanylate cyclase [Clostridia bacterium]|nr:diguanylate cyclase [Clostridia bacterium]